jgi:hypothetical protein
MSEDFNGENRRKKFQWSNVQFSGKDVIQLIAFIGSVALMWFGLSSKVEVLGTSFIDFKSAAEKWEDSVNKRVEHMEKRIDDLNDKKKDKDSKWEPIK